MAKVLFRNITKIFDSKKILNDFTLEIKDQEFIVLVGPSGCGKSTTLRLLCGLEMPSSGVIYIGDRCVNKIDPKDRDIAMVFQNYALYPHYSVFENLAFSLRLRRVVKTEIEERVKKVAAMLGLSEMLHLKPKALSGGQRQRVALGRAIVRNPKVFLMDEPLSNLDAKLRVQMRAELIQLQKRLHTTTLYVTHDQIEAMTMGDRIVVLNEGEIQQIGTPLEIYHRPANRFVAGFMGSPSMNFLERGRLTLGVRPEDIEWVPKVSTEQWKMESTFIMVEPLGAEYLIHFEVEGSRWVVRSSEPCSLTFGEKKTLYINFDKIFLFDENEQGRCIEDSSFSFNSLLKKAA